MNRFPNPARMLAGVRTDSYVQTTTPGAVQMAPGDASRVSAFFSLSPSSPLTASAFAYLCVRDGNRLVALAVLNADHPTEFITRESCGHLLTGPLLIIGQTDVTEVTLISVSNINPEA